MHAWRSSSRGDIVLIGGGGHALVVAESARLAGFTLAGFLDDAEDAVLMGLDHPPPRLGALTDLDCLGKYPWILAVGDLARRRALLDELADRGSAVPAAIVIHPAATVCPSARIEAGSWVGPGAVVQTLARLGLHVIVNTGAIVEHECDIGANAHLGPRCVLGGRVRIGADALVGIGATVLPGVSIGARSLVGAGAVVTSDVPEGGRVAGVPARPI